MKLSRRLETIASFVIEGSKIADIGTDHGYVPIFLVKEGVALSAIAMDIRSGPLERARRHVRENGLEEQIIIRKSDGLSSLVPGEADTVIIAGMGGELTVHILEEGRHMWGSVSRWILSPQSEIGKVRRYLEKNGFCIQKEAMLLEDGKYYTVMSVVPGKMEYGKEQYYRYGECLIREKDPALREYLEQEKEKLQGILEVLRRQNTPGALSRIETIKHEIRLMEETQDEMR